MRERRFKNPRERTTAERYEAGRNAREWNARNAYNQMQRTGDYSKSYDQVRRERFAACDRVDKEQGNS